MTRLKLGPLVHETPVKLTIEVPAAVHRDLIAYADLLGRETGKTIEPARIVAPMLARFMGSDRGFATLRRAQAKTSRGTNTAPPDDQADRD
ncbi:DUF2274 domain-containing protein [Jannaschia rubra]|uniref:DUF2274 domain-containing protein n=1 Tax=Jannaschia rubra TaxID=282197 RepID=UPI002493CCF2|nr:DUF2274 domain-containing protein [Jannaschia rubra]